MINSFNTVVFLQEIQKNFIKKIFTICLFTLLLNLAGAGSVFSAPEGYGLEQDIALWDPPAEAIHIDPENVGDSLADGSLLHPFSSFHATGFPWANDTVYALKRGTVLSDTAVEIRSPGITIASYGDSPIRPKFYCTSQNQTGVNVHAFYTWDAARADITIRDIEIEAPFGTSSIRLMRAANSDKGINIINCKLHGGTWGLRVLYTSNITIENTEVFNTRDDGIFIQGVTDLEIKNCYVHNVNTNWQPPDTPETEAAGDGIQLSSSDRWHVHHNVIDRTSSGNKFCFISNNAEQTEGILEYNYMIGPLVDGATVYMHNGDGIIIRYNIMKGPSSCPLYSHGTNIQIYGNVMSGIDGPIYTSQSSNIYNNVFYDMGGAIKGGTISAMNNIFVMKEGYDAFAAVSNLTQKNNFFAGTPPAGELGGDPLFINPEEDDFRLKLESACLDAGITVPLGDEDMASKYEGPVSEVGAIENSM